MHDDGTRELSELSNHRICEARCQVNEFQRALGKLNFSMKGKLIFTKLSGISLLTPEHLKSDQLPRLQSEIVGTK